MKETRRAKQHSRQASRQWSPQKNRKDKREWASPQFLEWMLLCFSTCFLGLFEPLFVKYVLGALARATPLYYDDI